MTQITLTGTAKVPAGTAWAGAFVEVFEAANPDRIARAVTAADGTFSIIVTTNSTADLACIAKLPDGSMFAFTLDPDEEEIALGTLKSAGGSGAVGFGQVADPMTIGGLAVTIGAADTGGTGFRALVVPNEEEE